MKCRRGSGRTTRLLADAIDRATKTDQRVYFVVWHHMQQRQVEQMLHEEFRLYYPPKNLWFCTYDSNRWRGHLHVFDHYVHEMLAQRDGIRMTDQIPCYLDVGGFMKDHYVDSDIIHQRRAYRFIIPQKLSCAIDTIDVHTPVETTIDVATFIFQGNFKDGKPILEEA